MRGTQAEPRCKTSDQKEANDNSKRPGVISRFPGTSPEYTCLNNFLCLAFRSQAFLCLQVRGLFGFELLALFLLDLTRHTSECLGHCLIGERDLLTQGQEIGRAAWRERVWQ